MDAMPLYKKFIDGVPDYLARYYWWAYLWGWGIWFFDHQPIINAILFGQYDRLLRNTLARVETGEGARILQLTCVYGKLTPALLSSTPCEVHLCDIANGQLRLARSKVVSYGERCQLTRMNTECLGYADDCFDQVIVFFLLHELPAVARHRTYAEIARVLRPGGSLLITEYASAPRHHLLYRFLPFRCLLGHLEPFLPAFWQEDVQAQLESAFVAQGKRLEDEFVEEHCFADFYRILRFKVAPRDLEPH